MSGQAAPDSESSVPGEDERTARLPDPEDRGAPVAESHIVVTEHDGNMRVDIGDDATARPGPGPGQPEADGA